MIFAERLDWLDKEYLNSMKAGGRLGDQAPEGL
jgi:hypothetical protein